jgi:hypothetical protein
MLRAAVAVAVAVAVAAAEKQKGEAKCNASCVRRWTPLRMHESCGTGGSKTCVDIGVWKQCGC